MCKGDGGRVLSNVELILPWNVVEACYTLERNDSTCFFAANDAEGTTSQISLCKLEDHSVKIQVTVTALDPDEDEEEEEEEDANRREDVPQASVKGEGTPDGRTTRSGQSPVRHRKKLHPDLNLPPDEYANESNESPAGTGRKTRGRGKQTGSPAVSRRQARQLEDTPTRKRNQGFSLKQARSLLGTPQGKDGQSSDEASPTKRSLRGHGQEGGMEPAMPVLEAAADEEQEIDLETIYKYGSQMREYEARKKREEENWQKVQDELKLGKDRMSMVIVLKTEDSGGVKEVTPSKVRQPVKAKKKKVPTATLR